jgi:hypothetical protein
MTLPDIINGLFESAGGFFIALSVIKLYREKLVRGVSWVHAAFFSTWGYWNLFFYPNLGQWFSFFGGAFLVAMNTAWLFQMAYYLRAERLTKAKDALDHKDWIR